MSILLIKARSKNQFSIPWQENDLFVLQVENNERVLLDKDDASLEETMDKC